MGLSGLQENTEVLSAETGCSRWLPQLTAALTAGLWLENIAVLSKTRLCCFSHGLCRSCISVFSACVSASLLPLLAAALEDYNLLNFLSPLFKSLLGISRREAGDCHRIRHFENTFVVETVICKKS